MRYHRVGPILAVAAAVLAPMLRDLRAQSRGLEVGYGRWWHGGSSAIAYMAAIYRPLLGPVDYGLGLSHLDDSGSPLDRTRTGVDLSLAVGRQRPGLYGVISGGLGLQHQGGDLDAAWSAGAGYAIRPLGFLTLGLEARYRVEDQFARGFWRLDPSDRDGVIVQARVALGLGSRPRRPAGAPMRGDPLPAPAQPAILDAGLEGGASEEAASRAAQVVQTALDVMGTPYRWGGSGEDGYDCSGLIQYSYGEYGILLPRVSRDQARTGTRVEPTVAALRPGDILTFALNGGRVSHVGLYVGDGTFIHSAGTGVKLSSLTAEDGESRWWQARWVGARRILN